MDVCPLFPVSAANETCWNSFINLCFTTEWQMFTYFQKVSNLAIGNKHKTQTYSITSTCNKVNVRNGAVSYSFLTSALDGGEWSDSRPGRFTPRERATGTHWKGGWVGPSAVVDAIVKRKIPSPLRKSNSKNPDRPACSPALHRLSHHKGDIKRVCISRRVHITRVSSNMSCTCWLRTVEAVSPPPNPHNLC
jgi:hypothetical protein